MDLLLGEEIYQPVSISDLLLLARFIARSLITHISFLRFPESLTVRLLKCAIKIFLPKLLLFPWISSFSILTAIF